MAVIQDLAGNPLVTQTSPMVGFVPAAAPPSPLNLEMYQFIIEVIRQEDQQKGGKFLQRFVQGPQEVWKTITAKALDIKTLWNITKVDARFLPFLKHIVGWTDELDSVTRDLDSLTLRRLISASVPFWKRRGPEDVLENILFLLTEARTRVLTWFDIRWITDDNAYLGEVWQEGSDIWTASEADAYEYNIRIVDNGSLNRQLVQDIARLTRPVGETVVISYLMFLDLFIQPEDNTQWADELNPLGNNGGASVSVVADNTMTLDNGGQLEESYVHLDNFGVNANEWVSYVYLVRVRGRNYRLQAYRTDTRYSYEVIANHAANTLALYSVNNSVYTLLQSYNLNLIGLTLSTTLNNVIRIMVAPTPPPDPAGTTIAVYIEGIKIIEVNHTGPAVHSAGTVGFGHQAGATDFVAVDFVEVFPVGMEADTIGTNS